MVFADISKSILHTIVGWISLLFDAFQYKSLQFQFAFPVADEILENMFFQQRFPDQRAKIPLWFMAATAKNIHTNEDESEGCGQLWRETGYVHPSIEGEKGCTTW